MKIKLEQIWEWIDDNLSFIGAINVLVFAFALVFTSVYFLVSLFDLSGFIKYVIIIIIGTLILFPTFFLIYSSSIVFGNNVRRLWEQIKSDRNSVWNLFFSFIRNHAMIFAIVMVYILFYRFWESWIGIHIIDPFLSNFESNLLNDIFFIIILIVCLVLVYVNFDCVNVKRQHSLAFPIIALVVWAYYRFHHGLCGMIDSQYYLHLIPLSTLKPIKYFDIVFVLAIYECYFYFFTKGFNTDFSIIKFEKNQGLKRNLPIIKKDDDLLERDEFAESVVDELLKTDTSNSSFTCGIDAPWGSGKTSFIYLMKAHLGLNGIIIDFNPWSYTAKKDLVTAFFDELSKTLKLYDKSLAKNLIDYSKLLSAFNTSETKLISSLLELAQDNDSTLQEKKQQISEAIKRISRKIIVFIDDLDRLETNEILEMMKLIRNVSDFPYMYIIAAYDKSYLVKCLYMKMKSGAANFIEKIFEQEHILAPCSNESLRRVLADQLSKLGDGSLLSPELEDYIMDHNNKSLNALSNLREIYRLSNSIASSFSVINQAAFHRIDLLLFSLFKTKYPVAFSLFEHKCHEILVPIVSDRHQYYELFHGKDYDGHFDFIKYLDCHQEEMCLNEFEIKTIKMILSELFERHENENDDKYRINHVRWFNRYLNLTQLKSDIQEKEFNTMMAKPMEKIEKAIDDWSVDKYVSLKHRILNYDNNNKLSREQLEKNIKVIFYTSIRNNWDIYNDVNRIISHLKRFNNNVFSNGDQLFIKDQLKGYGYSLFMSGYLGYLYKNRYNKNEQNDYIDISLDENNLIEVQQSVFKDCCEKNSVIKLDNPPLDNRNMREVLNGFCRLLGLDKFSLFIDKTIIEHHDNYKTALMKSLQDYVKEKKHIDYFLIEIIFFEEYHIERKSIVIRSADDMINIHPIAEIIWGSWNKFKEFLYSPEIDGSNPVIIEFRRIYEKFENNGYRAFRDNVIKLELINYATERSINLDKRYE